VHGTVLDQVPGGIESVAVCLDRIKPIRADVVLFGRHRFVSEVEIWRSFPEDAVGEGLVAFVPDILAPRSTPIGCLLFLDVPVRGL
jgi:hypothetical protein